MLTIPEQNPLGSFEPTKSQIPLTEENSTYSVDTEVDRSLLADPSPILTKSNVPQLLNKHYEYIQHEKEQKEYVEKTLKEQQEKATSSIGTLHEFRKYLDEWQSQFQELETNLGTTSKDWLDIETASGALCPVYYSFASRAWSERWEPIVSEFITQTDPIVKPMVVAPGSRVEKNDGVFFYFVNLTIDKVGLQKAGEHFKSLADIMDHAMVVFVSRGPQTKDAAKQTQAALQQFARRYRSGLHRHNIDKFDPSALQLHFFETPGRGWEMRQSDFNTKTQERIAEILKGAFAQQECKADNTSNEDFLRKYLDMAY